MADPYKSIVASLGISIPGLDLKKYGLTSLIKKAVQQNWSMNQLLLALYGSKGFKARFPGIRNADGTLKMSPAEYIRQENALRATMFAHGLGSTYYDKPSDFAQYIRRGITAEQVGKRLDTIDNLLSSPAGYGIRVKLHDIYGVSWKTTAKAWLLDAGNNEAKIARALNIATMAHHAEGAGFKGLSKDFYANLTTEGVSAEQAQQVFAQAGLEKGTLQTLARRYSTGELTDEQIAGSLFHPDPKVAELRASLYAQEKAQFTSGPGFVGGGRGIEGLKTDAALDR